MPAHRPDEARSPGPGDPLRETFEPDGYRVLRNAVPLDAVEAACRCLTLEIVRAGVTAEQIQEYSAATWFPHLRWEPEIVAVRDHLEPLLGRRPDEEWGDPQLLLRFPDIADTWPLAPHVDALPDWAGERTYRVIAGVALTPAMRKDGSLVVWPGSHRGEEREPELLEFDAGDAILMHPLLGHSGTLNRGGTIRYAIYFRLLTSPPAAGQV